MRNGRLWALTGATALAISCTVAAAWPASGTPGPARSSLRGSLTPASERSHPAGVVAASSAVSFDLLLTMRNAASAQALVKEVSDPGSAQFHHYLTLKTWVARYAPSAASITKAEAWLHSEGFSIGALPKDRLFVSGLRLGGQGREGVRRDARLLQGERPQRSAGQRHAVDPLVAERRRVRRGRRQRGNRDDRPVPESRGAGRDCGSGGSSGGSGGEASAGTGPARGLPQPPAVLGVLGPEDRHGGRGFAVRAVHAPAAVRHLRLQARSAARRV